MQCDLDNISVYYETVGEGRPIVIFHGGSIDHRYMLSEMEPIFKQRDGWWRIYPDLPGHGQTPGPDWVTHQDQVLDIMLNFIDQVIPGQDFTTAGFSYGGYLAHGVVYHRLKQVNGAMLLTPGFSDETQVQHVVLKKDPTMSARLTEGFLRDVWENYVVVESHDMLEKFRRDIEPAVQLRDVEFRERIPDKLSMDVYQFPEPFDKPTLLLMGRQDAIVGYENTWKVLENYPRATFAILDRAGHHLIVEQRDLFNALVSEWLDRVEEMVDAD